VLAMRELTVVPSPNPAEVCMAACTLCESACLACAEVCLSDCEIEQLAMCIRLSLDCAESCWSARSLVADALVVAPALVRSRLGECELACAACAAECRRQGGMLEPFAACARACVYCEQLCRDTRFQVNGLH
jgi:hypothetical protein